MRLSEERLAILTRWTAVGARLAAITCGAAAVYETIEPRLLVPGLVYAAGAVALQRLADNPSQPPAIQQ
jgi:hypothetical protein